MGSLSTQLKNKWKDRGEMFRSFFIKRLQFENFYDNICHKVNINVNIGGGYKWGLYIITTQMRKLWKGFGK